MFAMNRGSIFKDSYLPKPFVFGVIAISVLPWLLTMAGLDFSSTAARSIPAESPAPQVLDAMYQSLSGAFLHTLLEWTAFCAAMFTVFFGFAEYKANRNFITPVISVALFCAGCMDAFHTLAADHLIEALADNRLFIPFTWAICRSFNALILISGAAIILFRKRKGDEADLTFIAVVSLFFGFIAYVIIQACALSSSLPRTMYQQDPLLNFITRPYVCGP